MRSSNATNDLAKDDMDFLMNFGQKQDIVWENYGDLEAS
jgi:hypothetical protein